MRDERKKAVDFLLGLNVLGVNVQGADICLGCLTVEEMKRAFLHELIWAHCLEPGEIVFCSRCNSRMKELPRTTGPDN